MTRILSGRAREEAFNRSKVASGLEGVRRGEVWAGLECPAEGVSGGLLSA